MDRVSQSIYRILARHLMLATEDLRYSNLFEEQEYLELALKEIYVIIQQSAVGPAKKVKQVRGVMEGLCPGLVAELQEQLLPENIDEPPMKKDQ